MNFNGESVDNNAELDSKTQNIDLATTVALTTNFLGVLEVNGVPVSGGSIPQPYPGNFDVIGSVNALSFITQGGNSSQFVKGNGGLDLNTYVKTSGDTMTGNLTCPSFIKTGGNVNQYLMGDGSVLESSANAGNSNFYLYDNTNSISDITPITGEVIIDSTSNTTATFVYISHITRDNIDVEVYWQFINQLTDLYIQDQSLSTNYVRYNITGLSTITVGNKIAIPVLHSSSSGTGSTSFGAGHNILVAYFTNTLETDQRITNLETKTQSQTATSLRTTFTGKTFIRETVGVLTPHAIQIDCDNTTLGPRISSTNGSLSTLRPLEIACTDFNINCSGFNNIRCAVGQNISLIGNVLNTGYSTTSNSFITNGGLSSQFVKGDGTLDSTDYTISPFQWSTSTITFTQAGTALVGTSGYMPTSGISNIGGSLAAVAQSSTSTLTKIFKSASLTSSVGDGQKSGYIGTASFPKIYPQGGFNINFSFGIGDTNTAATSVCQMLCGFLSTTVVPLFSSALGPNITPNILGVGCDVGDSVFSFYMRGTTAGTKVATTIPCTTQSTGYYNLNIYNAVGSNTAVLTFKNEISGVSQIYSTNFSGGSPITAMINTSLLNPVVMRGMAVGGGVTGSAITHISRIQLSIK